VESRTRKYNFWNIEGIDFSAFQILPIVILVSFLSFSCQGNSSKKLNDSATVKSKPSIQVSQQLRAFPAQYDSLVGWEFKNNSIPDWKHVIFDYDNENKLDILTFRGGNQRNSL
jgi:hypothetical protein